MSGISGLISRIKKCQNVCSILNRKPIRSIVFMDREGNAVWEDGVEYNERGVLAVPLPMSEEEWENYDGYQYDGYQ